MDVLESRIPPIAVAALFGVLMWLVAYYLPGVLALPSEWRVGLALAVLLVGAFICLAGFASFRQASTTVNPLQPETASALVRARGIHCSLVCQMSGAMTSMLLNRERCPTKSTKGSAKVPTHDL